MLVQYINENLVLSQVYKITFSSPLNSEYQKIVVELVKDKYLASKYTAKQVFHESFDDYNSVLAKFASDFAIINIFDDTYQYALKLTKKGKVLFSKSKHNLALAAKTSQNRQKEYLLNPGTIIPPLVDMGIFTKDGKIVNKMYDKFKQINRFIELIDHELSSYDGAELNIIDFGCGKSYLTFILYYYLVELKKLKVIIVGLDLKKEVIEHCNETAKRYGYNNLRFELGDINGYQASFNVDMVVSLHACDTATDYALYNAICWNAKYIFSVPCCQHEVNAMFNANELNILNRYGLAKERISAIYTDVIRANLLMYQGYRVDMIEFVDLSHTPKNVLLRAVKTNKSNKDKLVYLKEVEDLQNAFSFKQCLYNLLTKN